MGARLLNIAAMHCKQTLALPSHADLKFGLCVINHTNELFDNFEFEVGRHSKVKLKSDRVFLPARTGAFADLLRLHDALRYRYVAYSAAACSN